MTDRSKTVVLLIDWDNLQICHSRDAPGTELDLGAVTALAQSYGTLVAARAYAEWNLHSERLAVYKAGIDPVFAPVMRPDSGREGKSLADPVMVADGVDLLWTVGPDVFVLVTSDKDMIPLARIAKQRGSAVVVLGSDLTAIQLVEMSNVFITYRQLIRELDKTTELGAPSGRAPARDRRVLRETHRPSSEPFGGRGSAGPPARSSPRAIESPAAAALAAPAPATAATATPAPAPMAAGDGADVTGPVSAEGIARRRRRRGGRGRGRGADDTTADAATAHTVIVETPTEADETREQVGAVGETAAPVEAPAPADSGAEERPTDETPAEAAAGAAPEEQAPPEPRREARRSRTRRLGTSRSTTPVFSEFGPPATPPSADAPPAAQDAAVESGPTADTTPVQAEVPHPEPLLGEASTREPAAGAEGAAGEAEAPRETAGPELRDESAALSVGAPPANGAESTAEEASDSPPKRPTRRRRTRAAS